MQSPIAKLINHVAFQLGSASTLPAAQFEFPSLREKSPDVWAARLSGSHLGDAIDLSLTFALSHLTEIRVRATAWDLAEGAQAWNHFRQQMTQRFGQSSGHKLRNGNETRRWDEVKHERLKLEKRLSDEGGRRLTQVIVTRTFNQPQAAETGTKPLFDLYVGEAPSCSLPSFPRSRSPIGAGSTPAPCRKTTTWTKYGDDPAEEFIFKGGPHKPKWPKGRPRPSPYNPLSNGPLFFSQSGDVDAVQVSARLAALDVAFDALLFRSEWEPFYQVDKDGLRHHSSRWWWLGGGSMLHVFVRVYDTEGAKPSIVIHAYQDLDCPPDQAVLAAPTVSELQAILGKADQMAKASTEVSA